MISWGVPFQAVVYKGISELSRFIPSHYLFFFVMLVISGLVVRHLHSKVYHKKATKCLPTFPWITYLRAMITCRRYANASFLDVIFGACYLFPKEEIYRIKSWPTVKYVVLYNLEAVKFVLGSRITPNKGSEYDFFRPLLGDGVFLSKGIKCHMRRKQLLSSLRPTLLNTFFPSFNKQANILVNRIDELMQKQTGFDVIPDVSRCTLSMILETTAGISCDQAEDHKKEVVEAMHRATKIMSKRIVVPWLWIDSIFFRTKEGKMLTSYLDIFHKFAIEVVEKRKRDMTGRQHVNESNGVNQLSDNTSGEMKQPLPTLDQLLNLHLKDNSVSYQDILDEILVFIGAGIETTSLAVSWTLYFLGLHQDIQRTVHEELDAVFEGDIDRIVTTEEVKSLKYLQCTLKEAMRLYPPAGIVSRNLEEDTIINGYEIEKGTSLVLPLYVVYRNPEVFPNPEKFIPHRFNEENGKNIPPFAYVPFSAGLRSCIGQKFAMYSAMTILSTVLRHFNVIALEHRDKIRLAFSLLTVPENGIHLKFTRRKL